MDWQTLTLRELIKRSDVSTRLENASQRSAVFETTIREFLATRHDVLDRLGRARNVGRTTIEELERLVDEYAAGSPDGQNPEPPEPVPGPPPEASLLDDLPTEVVDVTLKTLVEQVGASARLVNAAGRESFFVVTDVRSFLVEHRATLPKFPNLGRTSTRELAALVNDYLVRAKDVLEEMTSGRDPRPAEQRSVAADTMADVLAEIFQSVAASRFAPTGSIELLPASEGALAAVTALSKNGAFVIRRRYGLESFSPMTLNEVAIEAAVTRERVRQVEAKALKRLKEGAGAVFARLLDEITEDIWQILSGGRRVATPASISANQDRLEPLHRLAVDVLFGGAEEWATAHGLRSNEGWSRDDTELPSDLSDRLISALAELRFPRPLADLSLACGFSPDATAAALREMPRTKCLDGFVHTGFVGARARRAAMLYRLATQADSPRLFDIQTLAQMHRNTCPGDVVASRMVLKELQAQPHLFVRALDSLWLSLPLRGKPRLCALSTLPFERAPNLDDGSFHDGAIGRALVQHLRNEGPQRLGDLRDLVLASGDGSVRSVGPILLANPCFQRVLPGTYGLYCDCSDAQIRATITAAQCRHYAFARFGGAPVEYFPLWSPAYEHALCSWARFQAPTEVFRSLLFVASPKDWSLTNGQVNEWLDLQERYGAWAIGWPRREQMTGELPAPETFVSILAHVVLLGSTSWYGVNRCAQQKLDSQQATDVLALMIAAGLVKAPSDWQGMHAGEPSAADALEAVAHERWGLGTLDWHTGSLAEIVRLAHERSGDVDLGWLEREELAAVLRGIEAGGLARERRERTEKEEDTLGSLLQSEEWAKLFED